MSEVAEALKYWIVPDESEVPASIECDSYTVAAGQDVVVRLPQKLKGSIKEVDWYLDDTNIEAVFNSNNDTFSTLVPELQEKEERI